MAETSTPIRDQVIAEYLAGASMSAVARRAHISETTGYRILVLAGVPRRRTPGENKKYKVCANGCGRSTRAKGGVCQRCKRPASEDAAPVTNIHALPPGRWVPNGRGVLVYRTAADGGPVNRQAVA